MDIEKLPRIGLAFYPTPLYRMDRLSNRLGVEVFVKRDDLTGFAFGGNKVRKLEYLLARAVDEGADTVLTVGALQSNHCRQSAVAARFLGMDIHLILRGSRPERNTGNLLVSHLVDAHFHFFDSLEGEELESEMETIAERLRAEGRRPFTIPLGGSVPLGAMGYVRAAQEIVQQQQLLGLQFTHVVFPSGSGGTHAGLLAGNSLLGAGWKLLGMGVAPGRPRLPAKVCEIASGAGQILGEKIAISPEEVVIIEKYAGQGYGLQTPESCEAIKWLAQEEAIFLDHVYTGKAMAGLIHMAREGAFEENARILFIHTGGNVELFA
ncbi:MAG: D-cysteine desulfhydrase family protein [Deltaproteobacteria bacterium]|nr:D-cysteine desulfhydrase family protein [Deltaproteobacteria bacterium]